MLMGLNNSVALSTAASWVKVLCLFDKSTNPSYYPILFFLLLHLTSYFTAVIITAATRAAA